jgi:hypothetical protein
VSQWRVLSNPPEVLPIDDAREHDYGEKCWCQPFDDDGVLVHNSADEREKFERGERKPS